MSRNRPPAASLAALSLSLSQSHSDWENEEAWDSSSDNEAPPPVSSRLSTPRLVAHHSKQTSSQHSRPSQSLSSSSRDSLASRPAAALRSHSSKLNSITSGLSSSPKHQANDISPSSAASFSHGPETFSPTSNGYSRPGSNPRAVSSTAGGGSGDDDEEDDDDDGPEVAAPSTSASKLPGPAAFSADKLGQPWVLIDEAEVHEQPPPKEGVDALRPNLAELIADPFSSLREGNLAATSSASPSPSISRSVTASSFSLASSSLSKPPRSPRSFQKERCERTERSRTRFYKTLRMDSGVDISELKSLAWNGIPDELRPIVWQLLLGYLPLPSAPRKTTLSRKRQEYLDLVKLAFRGGPKSLDQQIWHQIVIDIPRTRPGVALWQRGVAQRALERILYVWAIRHPASGYVQGINDLAIPFFQVFLSAYIDADPETWDIAHLPQEALDAIEADSFWCLSKLLDGIQDNYIFAQPGIVRSVKKMSELVGRIDPPLSSHLEEEGVEFMQFAFRWMNCLLMREINMECTIRMWDTYLAEGADAFSQYHLYVCSAFLVRWSKELQMKDFQEIIMYLQALPTQDWTDDTVRVLLSEAYVLMRVWQDADAHFSGK